MSLDYKRLRSLTAQVIIHALLKDGFYLRHQSGSHQRYYHADGRKVTVPYHTPSQTFKLKTLKAIIEEQARWTDEDLKRLKIIR
ncbi:MAG: type II toxin-antitoxin system HicA family toxin [Candidatus Magnetobacterium sp. LHC-1]|uniref:Type II toxin-antitoxin system HicA family toxin n=1 Tax=Candidatus Magnetobacterium casense TaxID=1455061 RepID=A0ABS6RZU8_9BACT|nr:type II toxin-antitoxin system HicA family toxin [Candidatus Magnetobacterium casensis]